MTLDFVPTPAYAAPDRRDTALQAFTDPGARPKVTFPLVLAAVTVAAVSMSVDAVPTYSHDAFFAGIGLTVALSIVTAKVLDHVERTRARLAAAILLPSAFGAGIGTIVQALVLTEVGTSPARALKDLGGLVNTTQPLPWIASGIVLGGLPALAVSCFLVLASRALRRIAGHDAPEKFGVVFTGGAGLASALGLLVADGIAAVPLLLVTFAAALALLVTLLVDGSRIRFLRRVYAGHAPGFDVVPADRFANDPSLAPLVADARAEAVLVRVPSCVRSYRAAAAEPVALVAATEDRTVRPLVRRRVLAGTMLVAMSLLAAGAAVSLRTSMGSPRSSVLGPRQSDLSPRSSVLSDSFLGD